MNWLGRIIVCCFVFCGAIGSVSQTQAQRLSADWKQHAVQQIVSYLHVAGTDLVIASRTAGPVPPDGDRVILRITVDRDGQIRSVSVVKPSGYPKLDRLSQQLVGRAGPLPPLPASMGEQVTAQLPVVFRRGRGPGGQFFHAGR